MKTLSRQTKCARACVEQGGVEMEVHFFGEGGDGIDGYIVVSGNEKLPQISRWEIPGGGAQAPYLSTGSLLLQTLSRSQ